MQTKLGTLGEISEALEGLGYGTKQHEGHLSINVGHDVVATAMIDEERSELVVSCLLAKLGEVLKGDESEAASALVGLLDANSATRPFAFAVEPGDGEDASDYLLVLEDSVALGDFSPEELKTLMENLNRALAVAHRVISGAQA